VTVTFAPLTAGTLSGRISVNTDALRGDGSISLSGVGVEVPTPNLVITPQSLAFTERAQGTTSPVQTVFLSNTGTADLSLRDLNITGTGFIAGTPLAIDNPRNHPSCGATIPFGRSCAIGIAFSPPVNPAALGPLSGSVRVTHDGTPTRLFVEASIGLSGRATQRLEPLIRVTGSAAFGDQLLGTISGPQSISVTNTGTAELTVGAVSVVPNNTTTNAGDFRVASGCGTLIPNASCAITVNFAPSGVSGAKLATLNIANNAANGANASAGLSGTALARPVPILTLSATTVSFGAVALNSPLTTKTITVSNTGTASLNIGAIGVTDGFSQSSSGCSVLQPNTSCTITVGLTATSVPGSKTGTLTIPSNAASNPNTVALSAEVSGVSCSFPGLVRYQRNFIVARCPG
jgi:hypothetical protein